MSSKKSFSCSPRIINITKKTKTKKRGIQFNNKEILKQYGFTKRGYNLTPFQKKKKVISEDLPDKYINLNVLLFDRLNGNRDNKEGSKQIGIFIITHQKKKWQILLFKNKKKYNYHTFIKGTSRKTNNIICAVDILQEMTGLKDRFIKYFIFIKSFKEQEHLIYLVYLSPSLIDNIIKNKGGKYSMYNYDDSNIDNLLSEETLRLYKTNISSFIDSFD